LPIGETIAEREKLRALGRRQFVDDDRGGLGEEPSELGAVVVGDGAYRELSALGPAVQLQAPFGPAHGAQSDAAPFAGVETAQRQALPARRKGKRSTDPDDLALGAQLFGCRIEGWIEAGDARGSLERGGAALE
jgi:hypothetical protein